MKTPKNALTRLLALLLVSFTLLSITVAATGTAGSSSDPLVTLSYLNDTFLKDLLVKVDEKVSARDAALKKELSAQVEADVKKLEQSYGGSQSGSGGTQTAGFTVVTLSSGQTLSGGIGCEVMLRVGTATVVAASSPGLVDSTDGTTLDGGKSLVKNHLYMMTIEDRGVRAASATTKLLVRGSYTVQ